MRAMVLQSPRGPLVEVERPVPAAGAGQVLVKVVACGVCRTDLHVADDELAGIAYPIVPGHEVVGRVVALGLGVVDLHVGQRVGIPWLGKTCGGCGFCLEGRENLCDHALFTGYTIDGGYAEYVAANADYCIPLGEVGDDIHLAPLLCAGLIGYRCYRMVGRAERLGIYGFGAAAHIVAQVARSEGCRVFAFTRPGDSAAQALALTVGCETAFPSDRVSPVSLDAAIVFAPVGALVPMALASVRKGGVVVLGGIHMSDIPAMPYSLLWGERVVRTVANMTRRDGQEFFALVARTPIETMVAAHPLRAANSVFRDMRERRLTGASVLVP